MFSVTSTTFFIHSLVLWKKWCGFIGKYGTKPGEYAPHYQNRVRTLFPACQGLSCRPWRRVSRIHVSTIDNLFYRWTSWCRNIISSQELPNSLGVFLCSQFNLNDHQYEIFWAHHPLCIKKLYIADWYGNTIFQICTVVFFWNQLPENVITIYILLPFCTVFPITTSLNVHILFQKSKLSESSYSRHQENYHFLFFAVFVQASLRRGLDRDLKNLGNASGVNQGLYL